jgi:hypothetical protein
MKRGAPGTNWYRLYAGGWVDTQTAIPDLPTIEVKPYSDRTWAVYMDGELLCVTAYKRGAQAVERVINDLARRLVLTMEKGNAEGSKGFWNEVVGLTPIMAPPDER